jgi:hypothetical protein
MKTIESIELDQLLLDIKNPRIHQTISDDIRQIELAKFIFDNFGINDLIESIRKNGYFPVEPMVVIPANNGKGNYIVVEGNRRLTTIKILCEEEYRNAAISVGRRDDYIADKALVEKLKTIPVVKAASRDSVTAYLGVRHLGGVVRWEPLAQSKYVYSQVLLEKTASGVKVINAIEKFISETNNKKADVYNHFYKYCIYNYMQRLIEENKIPNTSLDNKFSLLEVAFGKSGRSSVAKYIGIESYSRLDPEDYENIIPEEKDEQTKNLINWAFSENPPIKESREINSHLKNILANPISTEAFEKGEDKDAALLLSDSYDNIVEKSCSNIHKSLTHIQQNWSLTQPENRKKLRGIYLANVVEKVDKTNTVIDIEKK